MKLYATITSVNNNKQEGKGGDKWIEIDLQVGKEKIGRIILDHQGGMDWDLSYERNGEPSYLIDRHEQAKKQKSESDNRYERLGN